MHVFLVNLHLSLTPTSYCIHIMSVAILPAGLFTKLYQKQLFHSWGFINNMFYNYDILILLARKAPCKKNMESNLGRVLLTMEAVFPPYFSRWPPVTRGYRSGRLTSRFLTVLARQQQTKTTTQSWRFGWMEYLGEWEIPDTLSSSETVVDDWLLFFEC